MTAEPSTRAAWKKVLLGALAPLVLFACAELGLRMAGLPSTGIYEGDRYTDWRLKADLDRELLHESEDRLFSVQTSSDGFRGEVTGGEAIDVVALGCSTTFGWGVDQQDAWPQVLEQATGLRVLNAGVPGHSTHQGVSVALELLERNPRLLILGWMVRDVQRSGQPDKMATAPRGLRNTRVVRWLSRSSVAQSPSGGSGVRRVSPEDYEGNLRTVIEAAEGKGIPVLLLQFPMQERESEYEDVLQRLGEPIVAPVLDSTLFFASDPIHLNAEGHRALAEAVAPSVLELLNPSRISAEAD